MKNRILSFALVLVMLLTSLVAVFPMSAAAADAAVEVSVTAPDPDVKAKEVVAAYKAVKPYATAQDMLEADKAAGYLDCISAGDYKLYVNKYTGVVYYQNVVTGQILTSNPYDHNATNVDKDDGLFSQIEIEYQSLADPSGSALKYYSASWIVEGYNLEIKAIDGGISIAYTLGNKVEDLYAPAAMMSDDFETVFAIPLFQKFAQVIEKNFGKLDGTLTVYNKYYKQDHVLDSYDLSDCDTSLLKRNGCYDKDIVGNYVDSITTHVRDIKGSNSPEYKEVSAFAQNLNFFFKAYIMYSVPSLKDENGEFKNDRNKEKYEQWCETLPALADEDDLCAYIISNDTELVNYKIVNMALKGTLGEDITLEQIADVVAKTRYVSEIEAAAWFNCTIEYTLDANGTLSVNIPAQSIDYNDQHFSISAIIPNKHFGLGNINYNGNVTDGYSFIPDGSGAIVEFADIAGINASISSKVYGQDACYSYIGTNKPNEQITMPVYGMVSEESANSITAALGVQRVDNGFFAIIDSAASIASISLSSNHNTGKVSTYNSYSPYPSDRYDLSQTLSVGGMSYYNMIAKTSYAGDCKTVITMLTDDTVAQKLGLTSYYPSTYVGMAACYKDYLKDKGIIDELVSASEDIPLYIEALGSIDVVEKILTFPVTVSTPLTTFEDVEAMYEDLINAAETLRERAAYERSEAQRLSGEKGGDIEDQIKAHNKKADKYETLAGEVDSIVNVNFKLTGFANGGMYFTYPARLKWERSVGGKRGFAALVDAVKGYNKNSDYTFGVYPDFDFLYINNTEAFDGISLNRSAARLVDNRYASRQEWNSLININGIFEATFSMLITPDEIDRLYDKFNKKYSEYGHNALSVSTLGSDVNSNFDEDNLHNREDSLSYIRKLLNKMANENNYSLMVDVGNIYAVEYASHIVNATIDSSHLKNTSYTIPFYGLVLHGYVNYAGTPINYSGSPDYEILRAIENGASLYYVLCCQNTNRLKEDPKLSSYYGINYNNWFEKILVQYKTLNDAIGELQRYEITAHSKIIAERIIDSDETNANYVRLVNEFVKVNVNNGIRSALNTALDNIRNDANYADYIGKSINIFLDKAALVELAMSITNLTSDELDAYGLSTMLDAVVAEYKGEGYNVEYGVTAETSLNYINFTASDLLDADGKYVSVYDYVTDSTAMDEDYDYTDFTCDNGNVVMVKYEDKATGKYKIFILNYNTFSVEVCVDSALDPTLAEGESYKINVDGLGFGQPINPGKN